MLRLQVDVYRLFKCFNIIGSKSTITGLTIEKFKLKENEDGSTKFFIYQHSGKYESRND